MNDEEGMKRGPERLRSFTPASLKAQRRDGSARSDPVTESTEGEEGSEDGTLPVSGFRCPSTSNFNWPSAAVGSVGKELREQHGQRGQLRPHEIPDELVVDAVVAVNEPVAQTDDPVDWGMRCSKVGSRRNARPRA